MKIISCELKGTAVALQLSLNEYSLYHSPDAQHSFATNLRAWMERENTYRFRATPSAKAAGPGEPILFSLDTVVNEDGRQTRLSHMEFPRGVAAPAQPVIPFDSLGKNLAPGQSLSFPGDPALLIDKPWRIRGPGITNIREVYELYGQIRQAFLAKDIARIMALSDARIRFGAKLYDLNPAVYEGKIRRDLERTLAENPQWKPVNKPDRDLTVHEFLPGRVMRILDLQGNYALMTVPDERGGQSGYDIIVALTADGLVWIM